MWAVEKEAREIQDDKNFAAATTQTIKHRLEFHRPFFMIHDKSLLFIQ